MLEYTVCAVCTVLYFVCGFVPALVPSHTQVYIYPSQIHTVAGKVANTYSSQVPSQVARFSPLAPCNATQATVWVAPPCPCATSSDSAEGGLLLWRASGGGAGGLDGDGEGEGGEWRVDWGLGIWVHGMAVRECEG